MTKNKTHKWLTENKIFFEVFSFLFLGIASLIFTWFNYKVAKGQLELQNLEQSPIINIKRDFNQGLELVNINNLGHHIFEPKIECFSYFKIENFKDSISPVATDYYFKISNYYNLNYSSNNTKGNIFSFSNTKNITNEYSRIKIETRNLLKKTFDSIKLQHLFKISYKNNKGEKLTKLYLVSNLSITEVSQNKSNEIDKKIEYFGSIKNQDLQKLNTETILQEIRKIYRKFADDPFYGEEI